MYRSEHPNPQFYRNNYECLNGVWEFETGTGDGKSNCALAGKIEVPFSPETPLSGVGNTELFTDCIYSRLIEVKQEDLAERLVLHFGAVDYECTVFVNGKRAGNHVGGYTSFEVEITPLIAVGKNRVTVCVHDDVRDKCPSGKQTARQRPYGCFYTRTTGIWQTVWLERTPKQYIKSVKFYPDPIRGCVKIVVNAEGKDCVRTDVRYNDRLVGCAEGEIYRRKEFEIKLSETHLWEIGNGRLYDVTLRFGKDEVKSYFGLRTAEFSGRKFLLNGQNIFQRLVLDQGYYPQGGYTAPESLEFPREIELARSLGFNGARLHQKVFEQRFLYECDRAGFMVWGEYASWGIPYDCTEALGTFLREWTEAVEQNFNHPSIILWCPLNEVWENLQEDCSVDLRFAECVYAATKSLDETRPCIDASGGYHGRNTDVYDYHDYRSAKEIKSFLDGLRDSQAGAPDGEIGICYDGNSAVQISEYGGIAYERTGNSRVFDGANETAWGYVTSDSELEFIKTYRELTDALFSCDLLCGFCYTQIYDVEQETNGLYDYDRSPKFSEEVYQTIRECNNQIAAIEKEKR